MPHCWVLLQDPVTGPCTHLFLIFLDVYLYQSRSRVCMSERHGNLCHRCSHDRLMAGNYLLECALSNCVVAVVSDRVRAVVLGIVAATKLCHSYRTSLWLLSCWQATQFMRSTVFFQYGFSQGLWFCATILYYMMLHNMAPQYIKSIQTVQSRRLGVCCEFWMFCPVLLLVLL